MTDHRVSAMLHDAGAETWAAAVAHPMVREIAAGTLPHELFRGYFLQNVLYLEAYARAIGLLLAYTRHLLAVCAMEDCAAGLAAVLPCQWSYGEIARPLMASRPADPIYADWIALFGDDDYEALVDDTTALLDRLVDPTDGQRMAVLAEIFERSTWYERAFWNMAYGSDGAGSSKEQAEK
jgi:thiaminase/transcriptional activator TenA